MIHWLEQSLITSTAFSAGAIWQWWTQRGTCRSCRIRYSVRRLVHPITEKVREQASKEQKKVFEPLGHVIEVALAFAFWDTMKLGWHLVAVPYMNQKFRRKP